MSFWIGRSVDPSRPSDPAADRFHRVLFFWPHRQRASSCTDTQLGKHEPWSAVPADDNPYVRLIVARILADTLRRLELRYPVLDHDRTTELRDMRRMLRSDTASAVTDRPANRG